MKKRYGPWALVVGGSEGIGAAFVRALAARGLDLVIAALPGDGLNELAHEMREKYGVAVETLEIDLADAKSLEPLRLHAVERDVGLLVYNAAHSPIGELVDESEESLVRAIDVNCRGPLLLARDFGRAMAARGRGGIILMTSLAGFQGSPLVATYAATKAFSLVLAEGLWAELRHAGVDVTACAAGPTSTPGYWRSRPRRLGRLSPPVMEPEEVVAAALGALGRRPLVIAGGWNRIIAATIQKLLPRELVVRLFEKNLRKMYGGRS